MKKTLTLLILLVSAIFVSGCASTPRDPVGPEYLTVNTGGPLIIKEFQEMDFSVAVYNSNPDEAIDSVSVSSFGPFTVVGDSPFVNIPKNSTASLSFRVMAPAFDSVGNSTTLTLSYLSGLDKEGRPILGTKSVPVEIVVLPNAELQFVGFAKSIDELLAAPPVSSWEAEKGDNVTVKFSVKNHGRTTIEGDSLYVTVDIENKQMGNNASVIIPEAMARGGTSYTRGLELPVHRDAPNGESDVFVNLMQGDYLLDSETLVLKVKL